MISETPSQVEGINFSKLVFYVKSMLIRVRVGCVLIGGMEFDLLYNFVTSVFPISLTPEQKEYQDLARKFSREVILPQAPKYDQSGEVTV